MMADGGVEWKWLFHIKLLTFLNVMCECECVCGNLQEELVFCFYHVSSRDKTQVIGFADEHLYPWSYLLASQIKL